MIATALIALRPQDLAADAAADPNGVVVSTADDVLTNSDLDRWSNRLARIVLDLGARPGSAVVLAVDPTIESIVVGWALAKAGALGVTASTNIPQASIGITTRARRAELSDAIDWLILDEPATMRRYMTVDDGPLEVANVAA
jgi:non-ribosomal peptide synthetase component E (peptide arylation enzyme)